MAILYLNSLNDKTNNEMTFYADDSALHTCHTPDSIDQEELSLQRDLDSILSYGERWAIKFNATKTTQQTFSNKKEARAPSLIFDRQEVPVANAHKHLGLTFSTDLRFKRHVDDILLKFNRTLSPLYPIASQIPRNTLLHIYKIYVQPHLDYCDAVYDGHLTSYDSKRLEKAQKRAARLITGTPRRVPTNDLLQELGLSNLVDRRKLHRLQLLHKLRFQASVPDYIRAIVPNTREMDTPRTLRNVTNITQPMTRLTSYIESLIPKTTRDWNELPNEVRQLRGYKEFNNNLSKTLAPDPPNNFCSVGTKIGNTLHTKLRLQSSSLNAHRFAFGQTASPKCDCGHRKEDTRHFLLACPRHQAARTELHNRLCTILNYNPRNRPIAHQVNVLMNGEGLSKTNGGMVAVALQNFLFQTKRFA